MTGHHFNSLEKICCFLIDMLVKSSQQRVNCCSSDMISNDSDCTSDTVLGVDTRTAPNCTWLCIP